MGRLAAWARRRYHDCLPVERGWQSAGGGGRGSLQSALSRVVLHSYLAVSYEKTAAAPECVAKTPGRV